MPCEACGTPLYAIELRFCYNCLGDSIARLRMLYRPTPMPISWRSGADGRVDIASYQRQFPAAKAS